ncbi:MAG TPA: TonB-dependent receptor [Puia sp.]|jgi:TonB-linked SusC/RagA family outer membrane protein
MKDFGKSHVSHHQMFLAMKFTIALLTIALLHAHGGVFSQNVTLSGRNLSLKKVFNEIEKQTGYTFFCNADLLNSAKPVSLNVKDAPLADVLERCFSNEPLGYYIQNKTVFVTEKPPTPRNTQNTPDVANPEPPPPIKGHVTDEQGEPLPGVSVTLKGAKTSTVTDANGNFQIDVPPGTKTLILTFVGMQTQEISLGTKTSFDVRLRRSNASMSDVVVIGYGTQRRQDVNGAVSSVKREDIANIPMSSVDQLLQGKAAGVDVQQNSGAPGSNTSVHIRGITSLSLSNEPLYVIDGVPMSGDANNIAQSGRPVGLSNKGQSGSGDGETSVSPLSTLNPEDIASIDILKDASATAIYGSQASNGVIIITTKRGKTGTARLSYDGYYGTSEQGKFLKMMNLPQYAALQNALDDAVSLQRRGEFANPALLPNGTNWQKQIFHSAPQQNHQVSISGGQNGVNYYVSGGYFDQQGTLIGPDDFKRYSIRANIDAHAKSWLTIGTTLAGSYSNQHVALSDNNGLVYTALLNAPDQVVYNPDGSFYGPPANQVNAQINPVAVALNTTNNLQRYNFNGSIYADLKIFNDLTLRSEANTDLNFANAKVFLPTYAYGPQFVNQTAKLIEYPSNTQYWGWREYLSYHHVFGARHDLSAQAGHEVSVSNWGGTTNTIQGFATNTIQTLNQGTASTATATEYKASSSLESAFARAIYTYDNKYSLTATFRADKSSKFQPGRQTGYFPAFAASWRISEEPFWYKLKNVADNVKFRVGYGQVGNQAIPNYRYGAALTTYASGLGTAYSYGNVANPGVTWETAVQYNIGLDFSLLNNRIDVSVDGYKKQSKRFLFAASLPAFLLGATAEYSGNGNIAPPYINGGQLQNKGIDVTVHTKNIDAKDFKWNSTFIFSSNVNKVVSLANGTPYIQGNLTISFLSFQVTRTQVGGPVGEFYGYKDIGIFKTAKQLQSAPVQFGLPKYNNPNGAGTTWLGDIQYADLNHDGVVDQKDQAPLGKPNPTFTYSIGNTFSYRSFDLNIFLNGSYGAKILNALNYQIGSLNSLYQNQLAANANFWTPANPTSNIPAIRAGDNANLYMSNRFIESGSYLRIQNVSLGYSLPKKWIGALKMTRLRAYVSGQNLYVFTPYKGLDPEIGALNQNVFLSNVDVGRFPVPRTITFGINAEF